MRHLFVVLLACFSIPALGQSVADASYAGNNLGTLHFYTPEGQLQPTVRVKPTLINIYEDKNASSTYSNHGSSLEAGVALKYGIVDRLTAEIQESYLLSRGTTANYTANGKATSTSTSKAAGFLDPVASLSWRAYQDPAAAFFADLGLSFSPSMGLSEEATQNQEGNALNGYSETILSASVVKVISVHELGVGVSVTQDSGGEVHSDYVPNSYHRNADTRFGITPRYRWHINPNVFVQPQVNVAFPYTTSNHYPNQTPPSTNTTKNQAHLIPDFTVGVLPRPNALLSLEWNYNAHNSTTSSTNPASTDGSATSIVSYVMLALTEVL